ncbi:Thoeris anti-defense Tad2 family protein [Lactococcus fujiensis]
MSRQTQKNAAFIAFSDDNDRSAGRMWNPMAKDILSNDWEVLN